jgi:hypothetical protein
MVFSVMPIIKCTFELFGIIGCIQPAGSCCLGVAAAMAGRRVMELLSKSAV